MNFIDLIIKKRNGIELSTEEINFFIKNVTEKTIPDYQISAMLMAICINSLNDRETSDLTMAMAESGEMLNLSQIQGIKVDKHSTGGVSDTTTLILAPLVASCGIPVIKMSGRGLGHTGGTLDKLESIPGFRIDFTKEEAINLTLKHNIALIGQTENIAPADKILYSLRDITGTVDSIPLIASSIMSKKIAAGADAIVLDVKCGNGAFMKDISSAKKLAETMVNIGNQINKKVKAVITDMNCPLGMNIGNSFEVIEAIEILKGNVNNKLKELSLNLGAHMLLLAGKTESIENGLDLLNENIKTGKGLDKFREMIISQSGNPEIIDNYSLLPVSNVKFTVKAQADGYINLIDTYNIGVAASEAGAGRKLKTDSIDYGAGILLKKTIGDSVQKGEIIAEVYSSSESKCSNALKIVENAIKISLNKPKKTSVILEII